MSKKRPFSFTKDGPTVELLYAEGKSVNQIAKELGRAYNTIKNYLEYKGIYRGPSTFIKGEKKCSDVKGKVPESHEIDVVYWSTNHNTLGKFKGYYNNACRIFLIDPDYLHFAYCKPNELITIGEE